MNLAEAIALWRRILSGEEDTSAFNDDGTQHERLELTQAEEDALLVILAAAQKESTNGRD